MLIGSSGELWGGRRWGTGVKFHWEGAAVRVPRPSPAGLEEGVYDSHCLLCLSGASSAMLGGEHVSHSPLPTVRTLTSSSRKLQRLLFKEPTTSLLSTPKPEPQTKPFGK